MLRLGLALLLLAGCEPAPPDLRPAAARMASENRASTELNDALVQFSVIAALAAGDYVEGTTFESVVARGDFGVGTFNRLDGELILLDGTVYQALADGTTRVADRQGTTPFAAVKFFHEDGRIEHLSAPTLEDLDTQLDARLPRRNSPYALRIDGEFTALTLRSVPAQAPPFSPLVEVVRHQSTWQHRNVRGTLVGLRCPEWIGTINVEGYHWHFLSDDRSIGGHVLACELESGMVRYDECTAVLIRIPQSQAFDRFDADAIEQHHIDQIERQRH